MREQGTGRFRLVALVMLASLAILSLGGCGVKVTEDFSGRNADQVWTALVAVAESPDYDNPEYGRWTVMENEVYANADRRRIEIHRHLRRSFYGPGEPQGRLEDQTWDFQVRLEDGEDGLEATFRARNWSIPAHVWNEAERYFADVREILGGMPAEAPAGASTTAPTTQDEPAADEGADTPPIDIDDLTGDG